MTLAEFYQLIGPCSQQEIDRLRDRYRRYMREHRQPFTDLLGNKFASGDAFKQALLKARVAASRAGKTSAEPVQILKRTSFGGFARTNERKFIQLATRLRYLRLTSGKYQKRNGTVYEVWPLQCDVDPPVPAATARKRLVKIMEPWDVGIEAIRRHTQFQDEM
jgi:hypothetical protein